MSFITQSFHTLVKKSKDIIITSIPDKLRKNNIDHYYVKKLTMNNVWLLKILDGGKFVLTIGDYNLRILLLLRRHYMPLFTIICKNRRSVMNTILISLNRLLHGQGHKKYPRIYVKIPLIFSIYKNKSKNIILTWLTLYDCCDISRSKHVYQIIPFSKNISNYQQTICLKSLNTLLSNSRYLSVYTSMRLNKSMITHFTEQCNKAFKRIDEMSLLSDNVTVTVPILCHKMF